MKSPLPFVTGRMLVQSTYEPVEAERATQGPKRTPSGRLATSYTTPTRLQLTRSVEVARETVWFMLKPHEPIFVLAQPEDISRQAPYEAPYQ